MSDRTLCFQADDMFSWKTHSFAAVGGNLKHAAYQNMVVHYTSLMAAL